MFKTLFKNLCPIKVRTSSSRGGHTLLPNEVTDSTARQPGRLLTSTVFGVHPTSRGNTSLELKGPRQKTLLSPSHASEDIKGQTD